MNLLPDNLSAALRTMADGLAKQRMQSLDAGFGCRYRGNNNTKCAIGMLIPDEIYDPEMERRSAHSVVMRGSYDFPGIPELVHKMFEGTDLTTSQHGQLLDALQSFHDSTVPSSNGRLFYLHYLEEWQDRSDEDLAAAVLQQLIDRVVEMKRSFECT